MVRRKRRAFGNTPLAYFKEHFGNRVITRGELRKKDPNLHASLKYYGQLYEAIPTGLPFKITWGKTITNSTSIKGKKCFRKKKADKFYNKR